MTEIFFCCPHAHALNYDTDCRVNAATRVVPAEWVCRYPIYGCTDPAADNLHPLLRRPGAMQDTAGLPPGASSSSNGTAVVPTNAVPPPPAPVPVVRVISDESLCQYGGCNDRSAINFNSR